jgi:hypothetical protein
MPTCRVLTCQTRAGGMHRFPEDAAVLQQWIEFCVRGARWVPQAASKVCTLHFLPADLTASGRVKHKRVPQLLGPKGSNLSLAGSYLAESDRSFSQVPLSAFFWYIAMDISSVFRIRSILMWVRIHRSAPLDYGSGSCSLFFSGFFKMPTKNNIHINLQL